MIPFEISEGIYSVGAVDWNIRDFHGYSTLKGTTYNSFLIMDEKITLVDTVKKEFSDQLIANIEKIVDPKKIDYVISNHAEMDHSGGLPRIMHKIGEDKPLYCSKKGAQSLARHFSDKWNYRPVTTGDTLSLGKRNISFMETRMLHWPDNMFTYMNEDKILFSSDAFGQHYASNHIFDDQADDEVMRQAKKYFANILLLYSPLIRKLLKKVADMGLDIKMICPDHGVLWRKEPEKIIKAYESWSNQESLEKAVVVYDTMWHSTQDMAEAICSGIEETGVMVEPIHIRSSHRSDIMTEVLDARAVVVGSPTINNQMYPSVADFLTYMKGLKPTGKIGGAFGSYGWSGESMKYVARELTEMKFDMVSPGIRVQYVPDEAGLAECFEYGKRIGEAVKG